MATQAKKITKSGKSSNDTKATDTTKTSGTTKHTGSTKTSGSTRSEGKSKTSGSANTGSRGQSGSRAQSGSSSKTATATKSHKLDGSERQELRSSDFGIPGKREFPMPDAAHVRSAEAYFRYASAEEKPALAHRILMKAKKFGVKIESDNIQKWAKKYKNQ